MQRQELQSRSPSSTPCGRGGRRSTSRRLEKPSPEACGRTVPAQLASTECGEAGSVHVGTRMSTKRPVPDSKRTAYGNTAPVLPPSTSTSSPRPAPAHTPARPATPTSSRGGSGAGSRASGPSAKPPPTSAAAASASLSPRTRTQGPLQQGAASARACTPAAASMPRTASTGAAVGNLRDAQIAQAPLRSAARALVGRMRHRPFPWRTAAVSSSPRPRAASAHMLTRSSSLSCKFTTVRSEGPTSRKHAGVGSP
mmetsp:Transcript_50870/g.145386  ORF Transcript_50870/g.145386 Transcript_50870/m.145386 type:complete len:254 (+) Transcript_50870:1962-2723(+)